MIESILSPTWSRAGKGLGSFGMAAALALGAWEPALAGLADATTGLSVRYAEAKALTAKTPGQEDDRSPMYDSMLESALGLMTLGLSQLVLCDAMMLAAEREARDGEIPEADLSSISKEIGHAVETVQNVKSLARQALPKTKAQNLKHILRGEANVSLSHSRVLEARLEFSLAPRAPAGSPALSQARQGLADLKRSAGEFRDLFDQAPVGK